MTKTKTKTKKSPTQARAGLAKLAAALLAGKAKRAAPNKGRVTGASMGPVTTINSAPVAIGNSIRGTKSVVRPIPNGVRVVGRDFMFTPIGTVSTITGWSMGGGTPLSPAAFGDSIMRQYMQMYQKYRWRNVVVHYITSSATSSSGDVMFYRGKNRDSVFLNQTSSSLLPFVISDPQTVIGPQWTNHSAAIQVTGTWKSTDYGMNADVNDFSDGELFLLTKTSTTESPGYVLFDYEVEFAEMQISPRLLSLPLPRAQYYNVVMTTSGAKTQGNEADFLLNSGTNLSGTTSAVPSGFSQGDIYKVVFDATNSTFTTGTVANLLQINVNAATTEALTITDGLTLYAVAGTAGGTISLYSNASSAYSCANPLQYGISLTFSVQVQVWISLIGCINNTSLKPNY